MVEDYKEYEQFYNIFSNDLKSNNLSHAYMFELDDSINIDQFEKDLCKMILNDKDITSQIDSNNYPNIKILRPDGQFIKKEQILSLQEDFGKESFDNKKKIYIIEDASKLNVSSANTMLKFLEEPEGDIVALLFTSNKYNVINTIKSRCLNISMKKSNLIDLNEDSYSLKLVSLIEKYKKNSLIYIYDFISQNDLERNEYQKILDEMILIYDDLIHVVKNISNKCFNYNYDEFEYDNDINMLIKKMKAINNNKDYLKVNINIKSLFDRIIYEIYGGD